MFDERLADWWKFREIRDVGRSLERHEEWAELRFLQASVQYLILCELRIISGSKDQKEAERHAEWLRRWQPDLKKLIRSHATEVTRIMLFVQQGFIIRCQDLNPNVWNIHKFSRLYRDEGSSGNFFKMMREKEKLVRKLKTIEKPRHLIKLKGVGPKTVEQVEAHVKTLQR